MTLIDVPTPGSPAPPIAQKPQPIVVQPPAEPVQMAANEPRQPPVQPKAINKPIEETAATPPPPVAEKPKPAPKPAKVAALPDAAAPAAAPVSKPSGLGYVAVLASVPASGTSRITALQQYADLQQRYAGILQNKTPDVTEANLGEKGRYHRLVVGPPGSKDGANSVCSQLKTAGYSSCWVMAY
jgi:cell division septation protein DedD